MNIKSKTMFIVIFAALMIWIAIMGGKWAMKMSKICEAQYQQSIDTLLEAK